MTTFLCPMKKSWKFNYTEIYSDPNLNSSSLFSHILGFNTYILFHKNCSDFVQLQKLSRLTISTKITVTHFLKIIATNCVMHFMKLGPNGHRICSCIYCELTEIFLKVWQGVVVSQKFIFTVLSNNRFFKRRDDCRPKKLWNYLNFMCHCF